ncbi:hypothetical protein PVK62_08290 [Aliivibrio sp. S3MY1]|uniref:hypothetical protein n=1 Tax=Aliivibrio sp. S3MY1 TaxID=3028424 RepID=UPI0023793EB6|nr:hypothetical protein [Aliivibrio sp. S3MY1]MDD9195839.1 hypothetical protein [Aliivibrio sp. S3MY1]
MKVFHTSPDVITKIDNSPLRTFADCLFFSDDVYQMAACETITYSLEIDEDMIIRTWQLDDAEIISEVAELFQCDLELAESILDASESEWDLENCDGEKSWALQALRGKCAKKMGYEACEDEDEQGTVYIIPMFNRESDLKIEA